MSNTVTSWILKLIDEVTSPGKEVTNTVREITDTVNDSTKAVKLNAKDTQEALSNSKKYYKELTAEIKQTEKEIKDLEKVKKSGSWNEIQKATRDLDQAENKVKNLRTALQGAEQDIHQLTEEADKFKQKADSWNDVAMGANQTVELIDKVANSLNFTEEIATVKNDIQRMTGAAGDDLTDLSTKVHRLGKVFNEEDAAINNAANSMSKALGISYDEALQLIQDGFEKGANLNGDMLDQMKEYGPQIREMGLSATDMVAIMAKAGKDGIFSDKAIDSIKEANLSLKEMGQPQIDALKGIGLEVKDLSGKTSFEAVQIITKAMKGATAQARQMALTDIFKGAGEDAGMEFVLGLSSVDMDLSKMPSIKQSGSDLKAMMADIESFVADKLGSVGTFLHNIGPMASGLGAVIGLVNTLTTSQWFLNLAMSANPIGLIIAGIVAVVAVVAVAITYWDEWGAALLTFLGPVGYLINALMSIREHWDSIVDAFSKDGIVGGIMRIGQVLLDVILKPVTQVLSLLSKLPFIGKTAGNALKEIDGLRSSMNLKSEAEKKPKNDDDDDPKKPRKPVGVMSPVSVLNGSGGKKSNKSGGGSGDDKLSISGDKGGNKTINVKIEQKNYFNIDKKIGSAETAANSVVGKINDRLRDAVVTMD